ncbi:iron ABC transporter permease [Cohnella sp. LGH]|uniref:ABC transporter permease n=1 Tax=Cohnella sp. LGH TaxID=1619153 RepID=UPI001ADBF6F7|nr:iron ABC transporter permease [Cohnella sp. LGH]QTH46347.1 iron ABC transporter permease [Cohnella sp. LGH]
MREFTYHRLFRTIKSHLNGWLWMTMLGAAVILLPILYVLSTLFHSPTDNWSRVKQYLFVDYALGSLELVVYAGFSATALGVTLAWVIGRYSFPLRNFYRWALILPLALPPYIAAYTYRTMTGYTGFIQSTLRNEFGVSVPPRVFEVVSLWGAVFILVLTLFPYVYMLTRNYLERQSAVYLDNAALLGHGGFSQFFRVMLPLARPAIVAGGMLVVFEIMSDYGVASYFGVQTLSTAIFQTWFGLYDVDSAMRLAAWLMLAVIGLFSLERYLRRNRQYSFAVGGQTRSLKKLRGKAAAGASLYCGFVFLLAFVLPVAQLAVWTSWTLNKVWRPDFLNLIQSTFAGAAYATSIVIVLALLAARTTRKLGSGFAYALSRMMTSGYAVPGAVVAIGVLGVFTQLDHLLSGFYIRMGRIEGALVLSLSLGMLLTGYVIRFFSMGYNALESGYEKLPNAYLEASRLLGRGSWQTFARVELPLLRGSLLTGFMLTFVEIVKELPLTLLLRPFNFDTLAARAYRYAADERIYEAAPPSLLLVLISLMSVWLLNRWGREK